MHRVRRDNDRVRESDQVDAAHQAANIAPCKSNRDPLNRDFMILQSSNEIDPRENVVRGGETLQIELR